MKKLLLLIVFFVSYQTCFGNKDSLAYSVLSQQLPKVAATNHDSATKLALKGLHLAKKSGLPKLIASANINYGIMMKISSKLDSAVYYYYEAKTIAEKSKDTQRIIEIEINLSNLYSILKENQKAISSLQTALDLASSSGLEDPLPFIYNNLGMLFSKNKNYNQAASYYQKAIKLNTKNTDSINLAKNFSNYAELLKDMKSYEKSFLYFQRALSINQRIRNINGISFNYKGIGELRTVQNYLSEALAAFEKSNLYADSSGSSSGKLEVLENLHSINAALGNWQQAYDYLKQFNHLEEEMGIEEKAITIAELEEKYKNIEKQSKIEALESEKTIRQLLLSKNRNLNYLLLFILAFLLALFIIILQRNRNLKQKTKIKQDLLLSKIKVQELHSISAILKSREDERRKISYNLHDSIGVMLATAKLYLDKEFHDKSGDHLQSDSLRKSIQLIDKASGEARRIAHELAAPVLEKFGLLMALKDLSATINETEQINVWFEKKEKLNLNPDQEVNLYRIIQELINNTIKHAAAENISIDFESKPESVILNYKDDGIGFAEKNIKHCTKGIGWKSIYSRIEHLQARIEFIDQAKGLFIQIEVPK